MACYVSSCEQSEVRFFVGSFVAVYVIVVSYCANVTDIRIENRYIRYRH
jgi:hypothetical protein